MGAVVAGKGVCGRCGFRFVYMTDEDWIRRMDEHYADEHPGTPREEKSEPQSSFVNVKCGYCFNRSFSRETLEAANAALDEHIAAVHGGKNFDRMDWTDKDLEFLHGVRISPL